MLPNSLVQYPKGRSFGPSVMLWNQLNEVVSDSIKLSTKESRLRD